MIIASRAVLSGAAVAAALALASPALAGDPVPGVEIILENTITPDRQRVLSIMIDRERMIDANHDSSRLVRALSENIGEALALGRVRASEDELMSVSRQVAALANAREAVRPPPQTCFPAWCANMGLAGQRAEAPASR